MSKLTKREFLKSAAAVPAAMLIGGAPIFSKAAIAAQKLTGVTYLTPAYESMLWGFQGFVERLEEAGGSEIEVDFYDSGTLLSADEQVSGLRSGIIDFMFHTTSYINRSFPILGVTGLPYLVDELYRHPERLAMGSPLFELIQENLVSQNLHLLSFGGGILEPDYLWSGSTQIDSLDAIDGKRIRVQGLEASTVLEHFGAAVVNLPSSELYLALQRGTIDGLVANVATVDGRRIQEQAQCCYKLPIGANTQALLLLKDTWDGLAPEVQEAMNVAAEWYDENAVRHVMTEDIPNVWPRVEEAGVTVEEPTEQEMDQFREASQPIWDAWKEQVGQDVGQRAIDLALGKEPS